MMAFLCSVVVFQKRFTVNILLGGGFFPVSRRWWPATIFAFICFDRFHSQRERERATKQEQESRTQTLSLTARARACVCPFSLSLRHSLVVVHMPLTLYNCLSISTALSNPLFIFCAANYPLLVSLTLLDSLFQTPLPLFSNLFFSLSFPLNLQLLILFSISFHIRHFSRCLKMSRLLSFLLLLSDFFINSVFVFHLHFLSLDHLIFRFC